MGITVDVANPDGQLLTKLDTVKAELEITGGTKDDFLNTLIAQVSSEISTETGVILGEETVTETLGSNGFYTMILSRRPVTLITEVKFDGTVITATEYSIQNANAGLVFRSLEWASTLQVVQNITRTNIPGSEKKLWSFKYVGGFNLPDNASPNLPGVWERLCIDMVKLRFFMRKKNPALTAETLADHSETFGGTGNSPGGASFADIQKRLQHLKRAA